MASPNKWFYGFYKNINKIEMIFLSLLSLFQEKWYLANITKKDSNFYFLSADIMIHI